MKKTFLSLLAIVAFTTIFAQDNNTGAELSIGANVGLPIGDFNTTSSVGFGGTAKFAYNFTPAAAATLEAGYMTFGGKTISGFKFPSLNMIPIKAGFRYTLDGGIYFEPQLGLTSMSAKGGGSTTGFTYAINIGYRMTPGIDVGARYETISKDGNGSFIGLRVAYSFSLSGAN